MKTQRSGKVRLGGLTPTTKTTTTTKTRTGLSRKTRNKGADFAWLNSEIFGAHWQEPAWEEVLLLLIAMLHDQGTPVSGVIDHVRRSVPGKYPYHVAVAARLLGEVGESRDQDQGRELLSELAKAIADHATRSGERPKEFVAKALGAFASLAAVVTAPEDVHERIARLVVTPGWRRSGRRGRTRVGERVASRITGWQMGFALRTSKERLEYATAALKDPEEAVRRGAIAALEREWPGRGDLAPVLAEVVMADRNSRVRLAALEAMQRSWRYEPAILDAIDARAGGERGYTVVRRLIEYLASAWPGNARALQVVLRLAQPRNEWNPSAEASVASAAAVAIARSWPDHEGAVAFVRDRAVSATTWTVREAVIHAWAAERAEDEGDLAFLRERAALDESPSVRVAALEAVLANWRWESTPEITEFVLDRAVNDPDASVRTSVIRAIMSNWGKSNWGKYDSDLQSFVRERAVQDADPSARAQILEMLSHTEHDIDFVREQAVEDPVPSVRAYVLGALSYVAARTRDWRIRGGTSDR
jgi:hypothetical protein